jgi:hypothetical protein
MLRIPHFVDNRLTDGGEAVSFTCRSLLYSPETFLFISGIHFWQRMSLPQGRVRLEGSGKLIIHTIGFRTRDLPTSSVVP